MYLHNHNRPLSVSAAAQLLSNTLYYKRFFPYYTFNLVAGLDEEGVCEIVCGGGRQVTLSSADLVGQADKTLLHALPSYRPRGSLQL